MTRSSRFRKTAVREINSSVGTHEITFECGVDDLQDEELHEEVVNAFAAVPPSQRARVYRALQLIMPTPAMERRRILDELKPRMLPAAAAKEA